ncbi:metal ABC transporter solute-binding protein, Zn/Mn family [Oceanobacillus sp. CFH 90083]|uniref:metal ABC transporter solute-binding protein, Zn/Mn family n=1 Tax=Oceanobacillus sp. CFH 90083 TaxID=2592336 RepID=UPI001D14E289|nr:zinc ABC transporter substrate-binding protein [Oceanobacillus sp. CFH 90083]
MIKRMIIFSSLLLLFLAGCQSADDNQDGDQEQLEISTTIFAIEDFISKIGGEYVNVESIYPPNADAHTFEPSSRDMVELARKDLFIYSGVGMEPFATQAESILKDEKVEVAAIGEDIPLRGEADHGHADEEHYHEEEAEDNGDIIINGMNDHYHSGDTASLEAETSIDEDIEEWNWYFRTEGSEDWELDENANGPSFETQINDTLEVKLELTDADGEVITESGIVELLIDNHDGESGIGDPHVFLDPIISMQLAENINNLLIEKMPEHEDYFTENFEELKGQLEQVDQELAQTIGEADHPQMIVSHAAYGYWEDRYGLEQISIHGLSSSQEPSQSALVEIVDTAREYDLKYVVFERNISSRISEIIQDEIGADSAVLSNMETITEEDIENGEDYFSLMQKNIETLEMVLND